MYEKPHIGPYINVYLCVVGLDDAINDLCQIELFHKLAQYRVIVCPERMDVAIFFEHS